MRGDRSLEKICKLCDNHSCPYIYYENSHCIYYHIVKQELNKLEKYEKAIAILHYLVEVDCFKTEGKQTYFLVKKEDFMMKPHLSKEQYELLKEVLAND